MKTILHTAASRGHFDHGWLKTFHTFSFGGYYNSLRNNFGALRVLNDDQVAPRHGFDLHPHQNMEIITIPINGRLTHGDTMGHLQVIGRGELQVMSAGTGLRHSEHNHSPDQWTELLQIWIIPEKEGLKPRYEKADIRDIIHRNAVNELVSPYPGHGHGLWIHQRAWISLAMLDKGREAEYRPKSPDSYGVYLFVIEGSVEVAGHSLERRDGLGITECELFKMKALSDNTGVLIIEVPE